MRVQRYKHQTWAIPYTMHKEYADNKYSAINLYNNMVNLLCLSNVSGAAAGISCRTLKEILRYPYMIDIQIF